MAAPNRFPSAVKINVTTKRPTNKNQSSATSYKSVSVLNRTKSQRLTWPPSLAIKTKFYKLMTAVMVTDVLGTLSHV